MAKIDFQPHEEESKIDFQPHEDQMPAMTESQSNPSPSMEESALDQGLQGVTAGFSDELAGLGQAGLQTVSPLTGYSPMAKEGNSWEDIKAAYSQMRDQQRQQLAAEQKAHPYISTGANIAGGIVPAITTGGESLAATTGLGAATGLGTSQQDLANAQPGALKDTLKDIAIGSGLGLAGGLIGKGLSKGLNPEKLEVASSKMASSGVGINPTKELTTEFEQETGKNIQGSDIIKGIGKTLMDENALPMTGGADAIYDSTLQAIDRNQEKLLPILNNTQEKLDQNAQNIVQGVGPVQEKVQSWLNQYLAKIPDNSKTPGLMKTLSDVADRYTGKLYQADGNLLALNSVKKELQKAATDLTQNAFNPDSNISYEADLLKRMSGIVRQHIENLANAAQPGSGDQIGQINQSLSNLYTALPYTKRLTGKASTSLGTKDLMITGAGVLAGGPVGGAVAETGKIATELATGNPISRLMKLGSAKAMNKISKPVDTPIGQLAQKALPPSAESTIVSPWMQSKLDSRPQSNSQPNSTQIAANLYNATDDSLKAAASKLQQSPGLKHLGDALNESIDNEDLNAKNRAVFLILQNPQSRKLFWQGYK